MEKLDLLKVVYIIFIVGLVALYGKIDDFAVFLAYLVMGSLALIASLLHVTLNKLTALENALDRQSVSNK